jgi:hypothetical protein
LQGVLFLVKWDGYDISESSWEPQHHIPKAIRDTYSTPRVEPHRLEAAAQALEHAVQTRLNSRNTKSSVSFDNDIFKLCFGEFVGTRLVEKEEFQALPLHHYWHYRIDINGQGTQLVFPVRIGKHMYMKKRVIKDSITGLLVTVRRPDERLIMVSTTAACELNSL